MRFAFLCINANQFLLFLRRHTKISILVTERECTSKATVWKELVFFLSWRRFEVNYRICEKYVRYWGSRNTWMYRKLHNFSHRRRTSASCFASTEQWRGQKNCKVPLPEGSCKGENFVLWRAFCLRSGESSFSYLAWESCVASSVTRVILRLGCTSSKSNLRLRSYHIFFLPYSICCHFIDTEALRTCWAPFLRIRKLTCVCLDNGSKGSILATLLDLPSPPEKTFPYFMATQVFEVAFPIWRALLLLLESQSSSLWGINRDIY